DYGRLLRAEPGDRALPVLSELLALDPGRMEVRMELAEAQVGAHQASAAIQTLVAVRVVAPADAPRFFRIAAYAYLLNGDPKDAGESAKRSLDFAKTDEDRAAAERLISLAAVPNVKIVVRPAETGAVGPAETSDARPTLQRVETAPELQQTPGQTPPQPATVRRGPPPLERFSASGR